MIPSEVTNALHYVSRAFSEILPRSGAAKPSGSDEVAAQAADVRPLGTSLPVGNDKEPATT